MQGGGGGKKRAFPERQNQSAEKAFYHSAKINQVSLGKSVSKIGNKDCDLKVVISQSKVSTLSKQYREQKLDMLGSCSDFYVTFIIFGFYLMHKSFSLSLTQQALTQQFFIIFQFYLGLKRHEKSDGSITCLCADDKTEAYANGTCPATTSSGTGMPLMCDAGSQVNNVCPVEIETPTVKIFFFFCQKFVRN